MFFLKSFQPLFFFFFSVEVINKFYLPINVDTDQFVVSLVNFLSVVRLQTLTNSIKKGEGWHSLSVPKTVPHFMQRGRQPLFRNNFFPILSFGNICARQQHTLMSK